MLSLVTLMIRSATKVSSTTINIKYNLCLITTEIHDKILEKPSSGTLKYKILESQIIVKSLGAGKPKGLNRISKIY